MVVLLWEGDIGALSTSTGATLWSARAPLGSDLMNGVAANTTSLFVAVSSLGWTG